MIERTAHRKTWIDYRSDPVNLLGDSRSQAYILIRPVLGTRIEVCWSTLPRTKDGSPITSPLSQDAQKRSIFVPAREPGERHFHLDKVEAWIRANEGDLGALVEASRSKDAKPIRNRLEASLRQVEWSTPSSVSRDKQEETREEALRRGDKRALIAACDGDRGLAAFYWEIHSDDDQADRGPVAQIRTASEMVVEELIREFRIPMYHRRGPKTRLEPDLNRRILDMVSDLVLEVLASDDFRETYSLTDVIGKHPEVLEYHTTRPDAGSLDLSEGNLTDRLHKNVAMMVEDMLDPRRLFAIAHKRALQAGH